MKAPRLIKIKNHRITQYIAFLGMWIFMLFGISQIGDAFKISNLPFYSAKVLSIGLPLCTVWMFVYYRAKAWLEFFLEADLSKAKFKPGESVYVLIPGKEYEGRPYYISKLSRFKTSMKKNEFLYKLGAVPYWFPEEYLEKVERRATVSPVYVEKDDDLQAAFKAALEAGVPILGNKCKDPAYEIQKLKPGEEPTPRIPKE